MRFVGALVVFLSIPLFSNCQTTTHHFKFTGEHCTINSETSFEKTITNGHENSQFLVIPDDGYLIDYNATTIPDGMSFEDAIITIPKMNKDYTINVKTFQGTHHFKFTGEHCTIKNMAGHLVHELEEDIPINTTKTYILIPDVGYLLPLGEIEEGVTISDDGTLTISEELSQDCTINLVAPARDVFLDMTVNVNAGSSVSFTPGVSDEVEVNWGDGSLDSTTSHTYTQGGDYTIAIYTNITDFKTTSNQFITTINFTDRLTEIDDIGKEAFAHCGKLNTITLPSRLITIGDSAFKGCSNLNAIAFPNTLRWIDQDAFCGCETIEEINIPAKVRSIGISAFAYCKSLQSITVDESNEYYTSKNNAIIDISNQSLICGSSALTLIPDEASNIASWACAGMGCSKVKIPTTVKSFDDYAFYDCGDLTIVDLTDFSFENDEVPSLGAGVFGACNSVHFYCKNEASVAAFTSDPKWREYQSLFTYDPVPSYAINKRGNNQ